MNKGILNDLNYLERLLKSDKNYNQFNGIVNRIEKILKEDGCLEDPNNILVNRFKKLKAKASLIVINPLLEELEYKLENYQVNLDDEESYYSLSKLVTKTKKYMKDAKLSTIDYNAAVELNNRYNECAKKFVVIFYKILKELSDNSFDKCMEKYKQSLG